ncbi:MAG TPA: hypothetical protein VGQ75_09740 [Thermoanaerobaculia bacterium]|jgi:hypothetical protein|nr:hypothetical protein [Thermoanaerobaculia bacterium]HEV8611396.1 hypothetical protein [Thermoanaerobaculia bacterium]
MIGVAIRGALFLLLALALPSAAFATGHGPVYGIATPTLGKRAWSLDLGLMSRFVAGGRTSAMMRPLISYGITEDLQASVSFPIPLYTQQGSMPVRMMAMMPANPDVEVLAGWRFHRQGTDVGSRFESTAYVGANYPTDSVRAGVKTSPGIFAGAATGYASRSVYAWAGASYRRYMSPKGPTSDHPGDITMYSVVLGYRPTLFRQELPHPDWRIFVETVGEHVQKDEIAGNEMPNSGGNRIFIGPTVLGLYGPYGVSAGPLLPVYSKLNGLQPKDRLRFVVNFTYWF